MISVMHVACQSLRLHKDEELTRLARTHNATIEKHKNIVAQRKGCGGNNKKIEK